MVTALIGGCLIGLAATIFWRENGRIAGVSGILRGAVRARSRRGELAAFLAGLMAAGLAALAVHPAPAPISQPPAALLVAGALVGFGTRLGGGCTSGHGVCGVSRLRRRSIAATATFVAAGAATVFLVGRVAPWLGVR